MSQQPSRFATWLLRRTLPADRHDDITGDLGELFARICCERGPAAARHWYLRESLMLAARFLFERFRERRSTDDCGARSRPQRSARFFRISPIDIKLGIRMLFKNPGLTVVSTGALAIAIAIVAGFLTATEFMVRPKLPVPDGDHVVAIWQHDLASDRRGSQSVGDMLIWQRDLASLDRVGAFRVQERGVTIDGATELARVAEMTPSIFELLEVPPALGRPLVDADAQPGAPDVVVIGLRLWQTALAGDPDAIGQTIRIGGIPHTVVGIMPDGFAFPQSEYLWTPLPTLSTSIEPDAGPPIDFAVARLAPEASLADLNAELELAGARLAAMYPDTRARVRPRAARYAESFMAASEPELALLMHAARLAIGVLLLVVAVNVGALIYARNAVRLGEIAVRMALGASRVRVVTQMFIEAVVLSALAAVAGIAILLWPLLQFREFLDTASSQGDTIPYWIEVGFRPSTILVVVALALISAVLTGLLPAWKLTSGNVQARLQRVQQSSSGLKFGRTTTFVVVSQVALSVALLTVGGAQLWSFVDDWSTRRDSGVAREQFLTAQLRWDLGSDTSGLEDLRSALARAESSRELGRRAERELDVLGATFERFQGVGFFESGAQVPPASSFGARFTYVIAIAPNYFDVQGSTIRAGRPLASGDSSEGPARVAVVNEAFVRTVLSQGDPIGQRFRQVNPRTQQPSGDWMRIVGVVSDTPNFEMSHRGPEWVARPTVFLPLPDNADGLRMLIHARGNADRLAGQLQALAADVDPTLVLHQARTLADADRAGIVIVRLYGLAVGFFVFAALLLSTTGVYAMMSFTATQRTREIGIRTALGAPAVRVVGAVFSRAMKQLGTGLALGLGLGYLGADGPFALSGGLFADGPGVVLGVAALIVLVGLFACGKPMRRALRVEPTEALRTDG